MAELSTPVAKPSVALEHGNPETYEPGSLTFDESPPNLAGRVVLTKTVISEAPATPSLVPSFQGAGDGGGPRAGKRVYLARKVNPGDTIDLVSDPSRTATFNDLKPIALEPEGLAIGAGAGAGIGPRVDEKGNVVPHSIVGSVEDYVKGAHPRTGLEDDLTDGALAGMPFSPLGVQTLSSIARSPGRRSTSKSSRSPQRVSVTSGYNGVSTRRSSFEPVYESPLAEEHNLSTHHEVAHMLTTRRWRATGRRLAKQVGRPEADLVMARADEHKALAHEERVIDLHEPLWKKYPGESWAHSLRGGNEHFVLVGAATNGLWCPVKTTPMPPLARAHPEVARSLRARRSAVGATLRPAKHPHRAPESPAFGDGPAGKGRGMGLAAPPTAPSAPTEASEQQVLQEIAYFEQDRLLEGSHVPLDMVGRGPSALVEPVTLTMRAAVGELTVGTLRVSNTGSTPLHYALKPVDESPVPELQATDGPDSFVHLSPRLRGASHDGEQRFMSHARVGTVLPGETRQVQVAFRSWRPGFFRATWSLEAVPRLPGDATQIMLSGVCSEGRRNDARKGAIEARLAHQELVGMVREVVVERIVPRAVAAGEARSDVHRIPSPALQATAPAAEEGDCAKGDGDLRLRAVELQLGVAAGEGPLGAAQLERQLAKAVMEVRLARVPPPAPQCPLHSTHGRTSSLPSAGCPLHAGGPGRRGGPGSCAHARNACGPNSRSAPLVESVSACAEGPRWPRRACRCRGRQLPRGAGAGAHAHGARGAPRHRTSALHGARPRHPSPCCCC